MKDNENRLYRLKEEVLDALETAANNDARICFAQADAPFGEVGARVASATLEMVFDYLVHHPDGDRVLAAIVACRNNDEMFDIGHRSALKHQQENL